METSNYNFTDSQKESCAVSLMRDTVEALSLRDNISYDEALLRFTSSKIYSPDYLLNLYDYCNSQKTA